MTIYDWNIMYDQLPDWFQKRLIEEAQEATGRYEFLKLKVMCHAYGGGEGKPYKVYVRPLDGGPAKPTNEITFDTKEKALQFESLYAAQLHLAGKYLVDRSWFSKKEYDAYVRRWYELNQ